MAAPLQPLQLLPPAAVRSALGCGVLAPAVYVATDLLASLEYEGYSYADQAVSELFAIGAPTASLVVGMFTLSSVLFAIFATGVWAMAGESRALRAAAVFIALNALDALLLWIFFPMHMRGEPPAFTDTMHAILAVNPFVLLTMIAGAVALPGTFRRWSVGVIVLVLATALPAFLYVPQLLANLPTPGMGLAERFGQYLHQGWHAVFALLLLKRVPPT